jgi:MSHA biogenesis protein MshM
MYLRHFGFDEPPFRITPHTDFFFGGANRGATLEALLYAIGHDEGIVKVSGEVGSGKTMLCRVLMEKLPASVETIYLANPSLARDEILIAIADELKLDLGSERSTRVLRSLQDELIRLYSEGRRVVVLIDEAHAMPPETLEEIRLLSNLEANRHKLLQIVLFGQPELDVQLNTAGMRQLKERITHSFTLVPMQQPEIESYIEFRLRAAGYRGPNPFSPAAVRRIVNASEGLTRRINILADKALLAAFAANTHSVTEREVRRAVADSEFYRPTRPHGRVLLGGMGVAAGVIAGFAAAWLVFRAEPAQTPATPVPVASAAPQPVIVPPQFTRAAGPDAALAVRADMPMPSRAALQAPGKAVPSEAAALENETQAAGAAAPKTTGANMPQKGKLVKERFLATQEWLAAAPDRHYAIQLMTVRDAELGRLENFLAKAARVVPEAELHVYSVKIDGVQHYRAAYGDFARSGQAVDAIRDLPDPLKASNPYPRTVERMKSQNRQ